MKEPSKVKETEMEIMEKLDKISDPSEYHRLLKELKKEEHQAKLAAIAEKKLKGMLTLEDIDAKLDIIIEMLRALTWLM